MAGFGSLIPAAHQGIASLGVLMTVRTATCMVAGLSFLPALLNWLAARGWRLGDKEPSGDNGRSPLSSGGTGAKL